MLMWLQGLEVVDNSYFITEENVGMLKLAKEANSILVINSANFTVLFTRFICAIFCHALN